VNVVALLLQVCCIRLLTYGSFAAIQLILPVIAFASCTVVCCWSESIDVLRKAEIPLDETVRAWFKDNLTYFAEKISVLRILASLWSTQLCDSK